MFIKIGVLKQIIFSQLLSIRSVERRREMFNGALNSAVEEPENSFMTKTSLNLFLKIV